MTYVDGFVLAVPTANKKMYLELAQTMADIFKDHGALTVVENWGDDIPSGELTSFPMAVKCQADESVVLSWVTWPNKKARDQGMVQVMADPRMSFDQAEMPFDGKRLILGGFETILSK
ncbi:Uncharacterized conserved protein YbaA, DUF1428 family [Colwellia chukchiensis]|uniref:Uncharacterized conserved protein YbaA, DUF1428 family n=1 Tax=Colwellia chukchiensis TaxID=641665 RepID=A0A1H7NW45_9GAMM|nr:DUF1428 domain-containing protein [Colwellia chukchiensis]SEL27751.1 Uncharacterized conserved protein YbaA, DUF1428 family [Colwellia chukchiensis]